MYVNINYGIGHDPKDAVEAWAGGIGAGAVRSRVAQPPAARPASRPGGQRRLYRAEATVAAPLTPALQPHPWRSALIS
jgi:hypothetical protein